MKITKELHEFLRDLLVNRKSVEYKSEYSKIWSEWSDSLLYQELQREFNPSLRYELRIKEPETYKAGDKFVNEEGECFMLCFYQNHLSQYSRFYLLSLTTGTFFGNIILLCGGEKITEEQLWQMSTADLNTRELIKIN